MACKCAKPTDEYHGWECDVTGGECAFIIPDSKLCAKIYGEGPDAVEQPSGKEEGMERLTTEQIADMKEYFSRSKEVKTSSLAMKLSHDGLKLIDTIEAQQQEIEQLKEVNRQLMWENISDNMSENITAEQAEQIKALTADKDEQAGRIMQMEEALRQTKTAINDLMACNEISKIADVRGEEAIRAIDALLGGAEDGSSKDK